VATKKPAAAKRETGKAAHAAAPAKKPKAAAHAAAPAKKPKVAAKAAAPEKRPKASAKAVSEKLPEATREPLAPGAAFPRFALLDQAGRLVRSAEFAGAPYVVYFYPRDNTPGCTTEACDFRDQHARFAELGVRVLGVSADSAESHAGFSESHALPFTLLSDPERSLAAACGAWALKRNYGREYLGIVRSTFLVDARGRVAAAWSGVKVKGHVERVLAAALELVS
jgi:peroxiredoxin Q/BCP